MSLKIHSTSNITPSFNCKQGKKAKGNEIRTRKDGNYMKTNKGFKKIKNVEKSVEDTQGLIPTKVLVTRGGTTFWQTVYKKPEDIDMINDDIQLPTGTRVNVGGYLGAVTKTKVSQHSGSEDYILQYYVQYDNSENINVLKRDDFTIEPIFNDEVTSEIINAATPDNRLVATTVISGDDKKGETEKREVRSFVIGEGRTSINLKGGDLDEISYKDYSNIEPIDVLLATKKQMEAGEKPEYIPNLDTLENLRLKSPPPFIKVGENEFLVWDTTNFVKQDSPCFKVTGEVLSATLDYYTKKRKLKTKEEQQETIKRYMEVGYDEIKAKKLSRTTTKSILPSTKSITYGQLSILELNITNARDRSVNWAAWKEQAENFEIKSNDMSILTELEDNSYFKGKETSYGDSNLNDSLYKSLGVKVKRQNGDDINKDEITQIKDSLENVYDIFGTKKETSENFGLKISHSGDKKMHARKSVGLYIPSMHAIGVSAITGAEGFGFTLAHEVAHFMDNQTGEKETGNRGRYSSHVTGTEANIIATTFRKNMSTPQTSKYQKASHECFARSMEQYFAIKKGYEKDYQANWNADGNHPNAEVFKEKIMPLIDQFLVGNKKLLKSVNIVEA